MSEEEVKQQIIEYAKKIVDICKENDIRFISMCMNRGWLIVNNKYWEEKIKINYLEKVK